MRADEARRFDEINARLDRIERIVRRSLPQATGARLVSANAAAAALGLSVRTIRRYIDKKTLPSVKIKGARRVDISSVVAGDVGVEELADVAIAKARR